MVGVYTTWIKCFVMHTLTINLNIIVITNCFYCRRLFNYFFFGCFCNYFFFGCLFGLCKLFHFSISVRINGWRCGGFATWLRFASAGDVEDSAAAAPLGWSLGIGVGIIAAA